VQPIIELTDVDLTLGEGAARVHVLKSVSLDIAKGETVSLLGPSGSGKSTLLMTLAGLERPDSGSVVVDGRRLDGLSEDALARFRGENIGVVFQSFQLIPTMTALENVAVPLELAGKADAFDIARAELTDLRQRFAYQQAQGQRLEAENSVLRQERFPQIMPMSGFQAVLDPRAGVLDPEACIRAHLSLAEGHGATL